MEPKRLTKNRGEEDLKASDAEPHHDDDDPDPHKKFGYGYVSR